jgi:nitrite reductase/ring-hydroxylating ferredoxin subunit
VTPSDGHSAEGRGGLNRPASYPSDGQSAEGRGGLSRPANTPAQPADFLFGLFWAVLGAGIAWGSWGMDRLERQGEMIRCPWHGWDFDIRTGQGWCDPANTRVRRYEVAVAPGASLPPETLRAESFPVTVEDDYLVIEM